MIYNLFAILYIFIGPYVPNITCIQNFGHIERNYKMSFSKPADNGVLKEMELNNYMELLKTVHAYSMAIQMFNNYRDLGTTP